MLSFPSRLMMCWHCRESDATPPGQFCRFLKHSDGRCWRGTRNESSAVGLHSKSRQRAALATKLLWQIAQSMLPRSGAGEFNQAAMELGALVCLPRDPKCDQCPVRGFCRAHRGGLEDQIPGKLAKINYESRTEFAFVIADDGAGEIPDAAASGGRPMGRALGLSATDRPGV